MYRSPARTSTAAYYWFWQAMSDIGRCREFGKVAYLLCETYSPGKVFELILTVTIRAALYLGTLQYRLEESVAHRRTVLERWHNCLLIYWCNVAQRATHTSVCLLFFSCSDTPKPYGSHQNSPTKGTSMGMDAECRLVPEMIRIARHFAVWAVRYPYHTHPRKYTFSIVLGTCKTSAQKFVNALRMRMHRLTSLVHKCS